MKRRKEVSTIEKIKALPDVAGECFLFEAVEYLAFGVLPKIFYDPPFCENNSRYSADLFCDGIHRVGTNEEYNQHLIDELINKRYEIGRNPELDLKYISINHYTNIDDYDKHYHNPEERKLLIDFLDKKSKYDIQYKNIVEPVIKQCQNKLYEFLASGQISAKGFISMKYDKKAGEWNEIYEDFKDVLDSDNKITRQAITRDQWIGKNIDFNESSLIFTVCNDKYQYDFILVDFYKLCEIYPRDYFVEQNGIVSNYSVDINGKQYLDKSSRKYIEGTIQQNGGKKSYGKHEDLRTKIVPDLCKRIMEDNDIHVNSARELAEKVAKILKEDHMDLLTKFEPYKKKDGTDWVRTGTFYNWCNAEYKKYK